MLASLEASHRLQQRFVSDTSHELRTPLTTIIGAVEVLQAGAKENPAPPETYTFQNHAYHFYNHPPLWAYKLNKLLYDSRFKASLRARLFEDFADTSFTPQVGQLMAEMYKGDAERDARRRRGHADGGGGRGGEELGLQLAGRVQAHGDIVRHGLDDRAADLVRAARSAGRAARPPPDARGGDRPAR